MKSVCLLMQMLLWQHFWKTFELQFLPPFLGLPGKEWMGDAGATQVMLSQHLHPCWLTLSLFGTWVFPSVDLTGKPGTNPTFCVKILAKNPFSVVVQLLSPPQSCYSQPHWACLYLDHLNQKLFFIFSAIQAKYFAGKGDLKMLHWLIRVNTGEQSPRSSNPGMSSLRVTNINKRRLGWNSV